MVGNVSTISNNGKNNTPKFASDAVTGKAATASGGFAQAQVDSAHETVRSGANAIGEAIERSSSHFEEALSGEKAKEAMKQSSRHFEAIAEAGSEISKGLQAMSREWLGWAKSRSEKSQEGFSALLQCRSPQQLFEVQSRLVKENFEVLMASAQRISEISTEVSKKATQRIAAPR